MDNRYDTILKRFLPLLVLVVMLPAPGSSAAETSFGDRLRSLFGGESSAPVDGQSFLSVDEAFQLSASVSGPCSLSLSWRIADGYYLYRDKFRFRIVDGEAAVISGKVSIPRGAVKSDEVFGDVEVNTGDITVTLPLRRARDGVAAPVVLQVVYQGCKEDAICYPPVSRDLAMTLPVE